VTPVCHFWRTRKQTGRAAIQQHSMLAMHAPPTVESPGERKREREHLAPQQWATFDSRPNLSSKHELHRSLVLSFSLSLVAQNNYITLSWRRRWVHDGAGGSAPSLLSIPTAHKSINWLLLNGLVALCVFISSADFNCSRWLIFPVKIRPRGEKAVVWNESQFQLIKINVIFLNSIPWYFCHPCHPLNMLLQFLLFIFIFYYLILCLKIVNLSNFNSATNAIESSVDNFH